MTSIYENKKVKILICATEFSEEVRVVPVEKDGPR